MKKIAQFHQPDKPSCKHLILAVDVSSRLLDLYSRYRQDAREYELSESFLNELPTIHQKLDEKTQKYIHFAVDGAKRMTSLIDSLLDYSRVWRVHTEFHETDIGKIVKEILKLYESDHENLNLDVKYSDLPVIRAVPLSLKMVFQNLISNALKYRKSDENLVLSIESSETESHWQFSVNDNGIGIEEEHLEEVFTLFKRLHSMGSYEGTGIGLAICKKVVE